MNSASALPHSNSEPFSLIVYSMPLFIVPTAVIVPTPSTKQVRKIRNPDIPDRNSRIAISIENLKFPVLITEVFHLVF